MSADIVDQDVETAPKNDPEPASNGQVTDTNVNQHNGSDQDNSVEGDENPENVPDQKGNDHDNINDDDGIMNYVSGSDTDVDIQYKSEGDNSNAHGEDRDIDAMEEVDVNAVSTAEDDERNSNSGTGNANKLNQDEQVNGSRSLGKDDEMEKERKLDDKNSSNSNTDVNLELAPVKSGDYDVVNNKNVGMNSGIDMKDQAEITFGEKRQVTAMEKETVEHEVKKEFSDYIRSETDQDKKTKDSKKAEEQGQNEQTPNATKSGKEDNKKTCMETFKAKWGNYVVLVQVLSTITFLLIGIIDNSVNGVIDENGDELGAIIGLTALNMFVTPIILWTVGYWVGIVSMTEKTSMFILFGILIILIVDFCFLAGALPSYASIYIIYVCIKILLMYQFWQFGRADVKHYASNVIQYYLRDFTFLKNETKVLKLWPCVVVIIIIQMCLFILGCLAFVGNINDMFVVKTILLFLLVWTIKSLTHYLHFIFGRMETFFINPKSRINKRTNASSMFRLVKSVSTRMIGTSIVRNPDTDEMKGTVAAVTFKQEEEVRHVDGSMGKIDSSQKTTAMATVKTQISNNDGNFEQDLGTAIQVANRNIHNNNHNAITDKDKVNVSDVKQDEAGRTTNIADNSTNETNQKMDHNINVEQSNKLETEVDLDKYFNEDNFDPISLAFEHASKFVASLVMGSFFISISGIFNMMANFGQASRLLAAFIAICCACDDDRDCYTCCNSISCIAALYYGIAWVLEKISKFFLQFCSKTILTVMSFENIDYPHAIKKLFKVIDENKAKTSRTKMVVLDNAMSQHITHLILLSSSFGSWCAIWMGYGEYAPLIHVAGYLAGRTAFEMIDVFIQLWLVIWSLDPQLLGVEHPVYEIMEIRMIEIEYVTQDGTKKTRQEIKVELEAQYKVQKTTSGDAQVVGVERQEHVLKIQNETNVNAEIGAAIIIGAGDKIGQGQQQEQRQSSQHRSIENGNENQREIELQLQQV